MDRKQDSHPLWGVVWIVTLFALLLVADFMYFIGAGFSVAFVLSVMHGLGHTGSGIVISFFIAVTAVINARRFRLLMTRWFRRATA
jgi:hypothetical protein